MTYQKRVLSSIALVLLVALAVVFYQKVYLPKATFQSVQLEEKDFSVWLRGIGELDAQFVYDLGFPITGRVMLLSVDQGDTVDQQQQLAQLDDTELQASLAEAEAILTKTRLEIESTQREIALNKEQYDLNRVTYDRYKKMLNTHNVSQEQFDQVKSAMLKSKISLETAKIKLALSKSEVSRVEQSIKVVQAKLNYTRLYSPVSGLVIERLVEKGQSVAAAQPVVKVLDPSSLWIRAYIDERISGAIKVGQSATITLRSMPDTPFEGQVKRVDFQSDRVTQERVVYVGFNQPLRPFFLNEQAEVSILAETLSQAKTLPMNTFATYKKQSGVWVNRNSEAFFIPLSILATDSDRFAFEGEVSSDDRVLVMEKNKKPLFDGVSIRS
ncbi:MAG: efflux RND transporter periplasmic adaptor subunit [Thiomicrorhabdus sp.]|nr:efflux RND transporter periplasmic adaptor subunit [Thiomicrorhabdus sp.]